MTVLKSINTNYQFHRTQADGSVVHATRLIGRSYQGVTWLIENKYCRFAQEADAGSTPTTQKQSESVK